MSRRGLNPLHVLLQGLSSGIQGFVPSYLGAQQQAKRIAREEEKERYRRIQEANALGRESQARVEAREERVGASQAAQRRFDQNYDLSRENLDLSREKLVAEQENARRSRALQAGAPQRQAKAQLDLEADRYAGQRMAQIDNLPKNLWSQDLQEARGRGVRPVAPPQQKQGVPAAVLTQQAKQQQRDELVNQTRKSLDETRQDLLVHAQRIAASRAPPTQADRERVTNIFASAREQLRRVLVVSGHRTVDVSSEEVAKVLNADPEEVATLLREYDMMEKITKR